MQLLKLLLILTLASLLPGQLLRLPTFGGSGSLTVSDLAVFMTVAIFTLNAFITKSLKISPQLLSALGAFALFAISSNILATTNYSLFEITISSLFLIRFIGYFALSIVVLNLINKKANINWLNLLLAIAMLFVITGLIQFMFIPDLSFLAVFGWDPHQRRVVSTMLDPNFTGGLLVIFFTIAIALYIFNKKIQYLLLSFIILSGLILTFSRSSYLALITALLTLGIFKSKKIMFIFLMIFIMAFGLIPQVRQRILGAVTFDETAQARLESWQRARVIFKDHPLLGVGFNNYRFAQSRYGFFSPDSPEGGHSGSGSDSSLLLVAATSGLFGFIAYIFFLVNLFKIFIKNARTSPVHLAGLSSFTALLVHSQFVNSLFFPQIMIVLFFILGLAENENP